MGMNQIYNDFFERVKEKQIEVTIHSKTNKEGTHLTFMEAMVEYAFRFYKKLT